MRQSTAVALFSVVVGAALFYTALSSRESLEEFRLDGREVIRLRRPPSPRPGLLTVVPSASPVSRPSPVAPLFSGTAAAPTEALASYSVETLCGFLGGFWKGSERDYDRALGDYLVANGPRDESTELFLALEGGDWDAVADLGRNSRVPEAEEIAFLARTGLIDKLNGGKSASTSLDPRDLDSIAEFRKRDPENSFWPLVEAYLKQAENVPNDRVTLVAEAASLRDFRNPVTSFYAKLRRQVLDSGDDRAYLAYANLATRAPMLDGNFYRSLAGDVGRNPENDEMIGWIGKMMVGAQFWDTEDPGPESFMDAYSGGVLINAAERGKPLDSAGRREVYDRFSKQFELGEESGMLESTSRPGCDDGRIAAHVDRVRRLSRERR